MHTPAAALNGLDEAIVKGRLDSAFNVCIKNVTFELTSFRVNRHQTRPSSGLLQQVWYQTVANKLS